MTKKKKATVTTLITKPIYSELEMERRMFALSQANALVSNPVHALAANPQNIMMLANIFMAYVEGKDMPVQKAIEMNPTTQAANPQVYS